MQKFKIIGKPLLGEKYVEGKKKKKEKSLVATTSALARTHNVRAHALRSHQYLLSLIKSHPVV